MDVKHQQLIDCCPWLQQNGEGGGGGAVHGRDRRGMKGGGEREELTVHRRDREGEREKLTGHRSDRGGGGG